MWKTRKIVQDKLWKSVCELPRRFRNARRRTTNKKEYSSNAYQFSIDNTSQVSYTSSSFSEVNGKWVGAQPWRSVGADEIDYELHLGTKLDYIMYFNTKQLRHSKMTLLQNQCELERPQMLTILMLAMQNTRLAGYMLTGNRSMFLDTDGSVAWLYHCPKFLSPLKESLTNVMIGFRSCLNGLLNLYILSPVRLMTSHPRYPVWVITLMCFNLISRMTIPGINFYLIPCLLINLCCSS